MKYFTNKKVIGGFVALAVIAGLYFGYTASNDVNSDSDQQTTSTQVQEEINSNALTAPAVAVENESVATPLSKPAFNVDNSTNEDAQKNVNHGVIKIIDNTENDTE